ncbi:MAG: hypothetical protein R2830_12995 [Saprospiraceae bacterium]
MALASVGHRRLKPALLAQTHKFVKHSFNFGSKTCKNGGINQAENTLCPSLPSFGKRHSTTPCVNIFNDLGKKCKCKKEKDANFRKILGETIDQNLT